MTLTETIFLMVAAAGFLAAVAIGCSCENRKSEITTQAAGLRDALATVRQELSRERNQRQDAERQRDQALDQLAAEITATAAMKQKLAELETELVTIGEIMHGETETDLTADLIALNEQFEEQIDDEQPIE